MPDEADFLRAVIARPDDDAPRLVYADWLDEQGQSERAEFIRVQCASARLESLEGGKHVDDPRAEKNCVLCADLIAMRRRERELFRHVGGFLPREVDANITLGQPGVIGGKPGAGLRRGFVESVTCTADDWLAHGDAIVAAQPVQEVTLTTTPEWEHEFANDRTRLRGRTYWHSGEEIHSVAGALATGWPQRMSEYMLRAEWSSVKTWHLPDALDIHGR